MACDCGCVCMVQRKNKKLAKARHEQQYAEQDACPFKPKTNPPRKGPPSNKAVIVRGLGKYVVSWVPHLEASLASLARPCRCCRFLERKEKADRIDQEKKCVGTAWPARPCSCTHHTRLLAHYCVLRVCCAVLGCATGNARRPHSRCGESPAPCPPSRSPSTLPAPTHTPRHARGVRRARKRSAWRSSALSGRRPWRAKSGSSSSGCCVRRRKRRLLLQLLASRIAGCDCVVLGGGVVWWRWYVCWTCAHAAIATNTVASSNATTYESS